MFIWTGSIGSTSHISVMHDFLSPFLDVTRMSMSTVSFTQKCLEITQKCVKITLLLAKRTLFVKYYKRLSGLFFVDSGILFL